MAQINPHTRWKSHIVWKPNIPFKAGIMLKSKGEKKGNGNNIKDSLDSTHHDKGKAKKIWHACYVAMCSEWYWWSIFTLDMPTCLLVANDDTYVKEWFLKWVHTFMLFINVIDFLTTMMADKLALLCTYALAIGCHRGKKHETYLFSHEKLNLNQAIQYLWLQKGCMVMAHEANLGE